MYPVCDSPFPFWNKDTRLLFLRDIAGMSWAGSMSRVFGRSATAMQTEQQVQQRREELVEAWQRTSLRDPAIGNAIKKSNSLRMLNRLGRRLKHEAGDAADDATRLAVRVLNPQKGDGSDLSALAAKVEGISRPDAAVAGVDVALAKRLAGDPRMVAAAVRWLAKNAKIQIASIHDPHLHAEAGADDARARDKQIQKRRIKSGRRPGLKNPTPRAADTTPGDGAAASQPAVEASRAPEAATGGADGRRRSPPPISTQVDHLCGAR